MKALKSNLNRRKVLLLCLCSTIMIGCASDPYSYAVAESQYVLSEKDKLSSDMSFIDRVLASSLNSLDFLKAAFPFVCICSILLGLIITCLVKNDSGIRRKAIFGFILGVPIGYILIVYIFAALIGGFMK